LKSDPEYAIRQNILLHQVFKSSEILKRDVDKVLMYFNLPDYIIKNMLLPSKLFPQKVNDTSSGAEQEQNKFPNMSKVIDYFSKKKGHVPNLILMEVKVDNTDKTHASGSSQA
jgi:hypothetical protein